MAFPSHTTENVVERIPIPMDNIMAIHNIFESSPEHSFLYFQEPPDQSPLIVFAVIRLILSYVTPPFQGHNLNWSLTSCHISFILVQNMAGEIFVHACHILISKS